MDSTHDFADLNGSLYVGDGEQVVPRGNRESERALATDALVA
jgi:hypothetical protein